MNRSGMHEWLFYLVVLGLTIQYIALGQSTKSPISDSITEYRTQLTTHTKMGISAHKGNSGIAPENTLTTFRAVLRTQVDYIEIDVRTTKDDKLIILHDGTLDRTTNGTGPVHERTLAELKKLSAAKGFGESLRTEQIPTLEEVCQLISDWNAQHRSKTNLYVDCKDVAPEPMVAILKKYGLLNEAVFYGSDTYLAALQKVAPIAKLMPSLKSADSLTDKVNRFHPYAFDLSVTTLTKSLVDQIHQQGSKVFVDLLNEADTPEYYIKAARAGVDVIQTDHVLNVYRALISAIDK